MAEDIQALMRGLALERQSKWKYEIIEKFPKLTDIHEPVTLGTFSWNLMKSKIRLIDKQHIIDIGFGVQTPPEVARDYISAAFPRRLRAYADQILAFTNPPRTAALLATPCRILRGCYIDVSAAYWSITRIVGYNVEYFPPDRWLGQGRHVEDFPLPNHKVARSSIISQGLIRPMLMWDGEKMMLPKKVGGKTVNQALWAIVQDVLHSIAHDLLDECELAYAHTDGFIVPMHHKERAIEIISSYGLGCKIKRDEHGNTAQGLTRVLGVGRYIVGDVRTKNLDGIKNAAFSNLNLSTDREFLRDRLSAFQRARWSIPLG